jgi:hypothetical protein
VQQRRHLSVRLSYAVHSFDRELAALSFVGPAQVVLARLSRTVRHPHLHRDVLAGKRGLHDAVVDALEDEGHDIVGLPTLLLDLLFPPYCLRSHGARAVEAALHVDQGAWHLGHVPNRRGIGLDLVSKDDQA